MMLVASEVGARAGFASVRGRGGRLSWHSFDRNPGSASLVEDADDVPPRRHLETAFGAPRVELVNQGEPPFRDDLSELGGRHVASLSEIRGTLRSTGLGMVNDGTTSRSQDPADLGNIGVDILWCDVHKDVKRPDSVDAVARDRAQAPPIVDVEFDVLGISKPQSAEFDAAVG